MDFSFDTRLRELADAGAALGARCKGQTPAQVGGDWRAIGAPELLRNVGVAGTAVFLDAFVAARGGLRIARVHAEDAIARAPQALEAALLAGGVQGLITEVVENVRLPEATRPAGFPHDRDPAVRHALADARAWSLLARNSALRAAWVVDTGTPTADVLAAPAMALSAACDAVLKVWPALSRLLLVEETYQRLELELFRVAARSKPIAMEAIAISLLGEADQRSESTVTAALEKS